MKIRVNLTIGRLTLVMSVATALCCAIFAAQNNDIVVRDAWVRVPAPSKTETAAYMVIENHGSEKRALVSATSDIAGKIELHQMRMDGKVMMMTPVAKIDIPARGKASLNPNSYHMMMFRLMTRPSVGDSINVILKLDDGTSVPVTATVKK